MKRSNDRKVESTKKEEKLSRKKFLTSAIAAAGALAATAIPGVAQAADGDALNIGVQGNSGTASTYLKSNSTEEVLYIENTNLLAEGGIRVFSNGYGLSASGLDVGVSSWGAKSGLTANAGGDSTQGLIGVEGILGRTAAQAGPNAGVIGRVKINGDEATAPSNKGVGVMGFSGVAASKGPDGCGVRGVGSSIGVQAKSNGKALDVKGKAYFSTAGKGTISDGSKTKTITGVVLDANAQILVTLQGNPGAGIFVQFAKKISGTSFKVVLNKAAANNTPFAWFIVN